MHITLISEKQKTKQKRNQSLYTNLYFTWCSNPFIFVQYFQHWSQKNQIFLAQVLPQIVNTWPILSGFDMVWFSCGKPTQRSDWSSCLKFLLHGLLQSAVTSSDTLLTMLPQKSDLLADWLDGLLRIFLTLSVDLWISSLGSLDHFCDSFSPCSVNLGGRFCFSRFAFVPNSFHLWMMNLEKCCFRF